ncbi:class I mannose-6-phosphate isomerase [Paraconexibacter antarcticus]|uniref:Class I mannose-6-phosphate isomerase n=1 Tax=Paraconexibacter antarcticus TaxID=2949664 RepID=A0ABY5DMJ9_9ACTN|nr:type I phosphomannose isomerase catalytic subunit [Paraconexibacter antarcticus]UTI63198.1 class I mannose-6-phosphate isomerase [Paraconexibacter antarcticus]
MPEPIAFAPLFMERIWGGRLLEERYGKPLPPGAPIGESWEVVDRPEAQSVVAGGVHAGRTLNELWTEERDRVFGPRAAGRGDRFPILIKLLDARDTLSVQVHPPDHLAGELGGEPKNELWYLADATPEGHLYVGLRAGVTREAFTAALEAGEDVSAMLHRLDVKAGDAIFIPSGRVHAIGAGCLIVEIQQNSDTTYRVFDFGRPGLDGELRELHVPQSMASIDWDDVEPPLHRGDGPIADNDCFTVTRRALDGPSVLTSPGECAIVAVIDGGVSCGGASFAPGAFFLVPAADGANLPVAPTAGDATVLVTELPG